MKRTTIGLLLMGIGNSFAVWSAFCPSVMTIGKFGLREGTEEDRRELEYGMIASVIVMALMWMGLYLLIRGNE